MALVDVTTIKLEESTKALLDKLKVNDRETYDSVLKRLVKGQEATRAEEPKTEEPEGAEYKVPANGRVRLTKFASKNIIVREKL